MTLLHQAAQKAVEALKLADGLLERRGFYVEQISVALVSLQAALRQESALQHQEVPREPVALLMKFYAVDSLAALVDAQVHHIEKLQAKLPAGPSFAPQSVREG